MENREKIAAVQRMQDYIEQHIGEPISLNKLAQAAQYSPWHSARIFKDLTGKTPFDYIRSLRLTRAAIKLKSGDIRIVDVAFDFVFESHEGFTRAFSKQFGISPMYCSKNQPHLTLFTPRKAYDYYLRLQKGETSMVNNNKIKPNNNTIFVQVIDRPARKLILKRGIKATHYYEYCQEVGCEVWEKLSNIKEAIYEPIGMWLPEGLRRPGTSTYAQGVEMPTSYAGEIPEGYEIIDLKPGKYMVFQGQPYEDEKFEQAIGDIWEAMKTYNPELYGFAWADEDGPRFQLAPMAYRGYIEARPVKQLNTKE